MISEKFSTNPESFNGFGRGRRIDLAISGGMTQVFRQLRRSICGNSFIQSDSLSLISKDQERTGKVPLDAY